MAAPDASGPGPCCATPPLPILHAESAFKGDALGRSLAAHGYVVLRGLESGRASACDASFLSLFRAPASVKARLHCRSQLGVSTRARAHRLERKRLPLAGIGFSVVTDKRGATTREQLHLVTDASALALVPWPRQLCGLKVAAQCATAELHGLAVRLLAALDAGFEATRATQAQRLGVHQACPCPWTRPSDPGHRPWPLAVAGPFPLALALALALTPALTLALTPDPDPDSTPDPGPDPGPNP